MPIAIKLRSFVLIFMIESMKRGEVHLKFAVFDCRTGFLSVITDKMMSLMKSPGLSKSGDLCKQKSDKMQATLSRLPFIP